MMHDGITAHEQLRTERKLKSLRTIKKQRQQQKRNALIVCILPNGFGWVM